MHTTASRAQVHTHAHTHTHTHCARVEQHVNKDHVSVQPNVTCGPLFAHMFQAVLYEIIGAFSVAMSAQRTHALCAGCACQKAENDFRRRGGVLSIMLHNLHGF